jgi:hypothetical protein
MKKREQMGVGEILVPQPPSQSTVEQLLALQQALAQLEGFIQTGNIGLLKLRTLCLSNYPEVSTTLNFPLQKSFLLTIGLLRASH